MEAWVWRTLHTAVIPLASRTEDWTLNKVMTVLLLMASQKTGMHWSLKVFLSSITPSSADNCTALTVATFLISIFHLRKSAASVGVRLINIKNWTWTAGATTQYSFDSFSLTTTSVRMHAIVWTILPSCHTHIYHSTIIERKLVSMRVTKS